MRSRFLNGTTMVAVLATGLMPAPLMIAAARTPLPPQGYCRNADPLPRLDPEQVQQQQREPRVRGGVSRAAEAADMPMAPPPPPAPPPPSPAAPVYAPDSAADSVVVTGARADGSAKMAASESAAPPPADVAPGSSADYRAAPGIVPPRPWPRPQPQPQSGILTAGEHDDLLNPELYAAYVNRSDLGQDIRLLPRVDTLRVVTVKVNDRSGQPIPFAEVKVTCSDGNSITMATQADGSAVFFPGLDRLSERITVSASKAGQVLAAARPAIVADAPGGQTIGLTANQMATRATKLDLMLVIDTTGSMGDEIRISAWR